MEISGGGGHGHGGVDRGGQTPVTRLNAWIACSIGTLAFGCAAGCGNASAGPGVATAPNQAGSADENNNTPIRIGFCIDRFPRKESGFVGVIDEVRWFKYAIGGEMIKKIYEGEL